ncbi:HSP70/90 co-chaperone [Ophidiomyces ophidiicola]|nr:HSP70/90 co-chaperone [Ophidiomyces ophidiicola]KAI2119336.1 HSP70/90 co-chaperone [Ophidiomyces ophidiicola]KAI2170402.1 HSP70/90 co-chaperone [Ophidiomyces ophidiicola]KAI2195250.1 HSP70/90 co-chaperone [Ophidiomyces ophidiicola]KAI2213442.1 HSP70/90 co-chaperone [Ophidiomyces ophidiicola]
MARIEELPSAFDDALNLNVPPTTTNTTTPSASHETPFGIKPNGLTTSDPTAPSLPPSMASVKSHSAAEIQAMLNQTPLFMTDVAAAAQPDEGGGENMFLEAIRALQHEGTQLEVARGFRETGNELAREKKWRDAREFYDKALATVRAKEGQGEGEGKVVWDVSADPEGDREAMREVEEKVLVNRALCNLEMKNYRSCTLDCAAALQLNPRNLKAYYRTARALLALDKTTAAGDAAHRGLALDPANAALQQLAPRIAARHAALEQDAARRRAADARAARIARTLATALRARGIRTRSSASASASQQKQQPELEDAAMHLAPDPEAAGSTLVVPCVVLYPAHAQSDVIKAFAETDCVREHLAYLLPAPWDREGEYTVDGVECFMETAAGGLVRVGKDVSLLEVLSSSNGGGGAVVEIVDGLVTIHVLPAARSARWIEELKARRSVRG